MKLMRFLIPLFKIGVGLTAAIFILRGIFFLRGLGLNMPGYLVLFFSLSAAFTWVEILRWGYKKPFNCVKCLAGWFALTMAYIYHTPHWYFYLPAGLFVGALFSAIKMKFL